MNKLYVVTRSDLSAQYQIPQAMHAALDLAAAYTEEFLVWQKSCNTIVVLAAKDEAALEVLSKRAEVKNIRHVVFREPDVGNQITSIAFVPDERVRKFCSSLPLAGAKPKE